MSDTQKKPQVVQSRPGDEAEVGRHVQSDMGHCVKIGHAEDRSTADDCLSAPRGLLEARAAALVEKLVDRAERGDLAATRLCLELLRHRPIMLDIPAIENVHDALAANKSIIAAVVSGRLTPAEAGHLGNLISNHVKFLEVTTLEMRIKALEERIKHEP